jgi:hypothetical protein
MTRDSSPHLRQPTLDRLQDEAATLREQRVRTAAGSFGHRQACYQLGQPQQIVDGGSEDKAQPTRLQPQRGTSLSLSPALTSSTAF